MPPPAARPDEQNPIVQSQLRELSSALTVMAQLGHAQSAHFRKTGEAAEKFGRSLDDARGQMGREMRDLLVAVHFAAEGIERKARDFKIDQSRRTQQSDTELHRARQREHWATQREHWTRQRLAWAERSTASQRGFGWGGAVRGPGPAGGFDFGGVRADVPRPPRGPFTPSAEDVARGVNFARQRDKAAGRTADGTGHFRLAKDGSVASVVPRPSREPGPASAASSPAGRIVPGRPVLAQRAPAPPVAQRAFVPVAPAAGKSGLGGVAVVGPAAAGLAAAFQLASTAATTWAGLLGAMTQAASPNVWRTFAGSVELLMASVGQTLAPAFVRLAATAQALSERFDRLSPKQKDLAATGAGLGFAPFGLPGLAASAAWAAQSYMAPDQMRVDAKTNEPRFSAVESAWENMALGFLRELAWRMAVGDVTGTDLDQRRPVCGGRRAAGRGGGQAEGEPGGGGQSVPETLRRHGARLGGECTSTIRSRRGLTMKKVVKRDADEFLARWPELWGPLSDARCGTVGVVQLGAKLQGMRDILMAGLEATRLCDPSGRDAQAVFLAADAVAAAVVAQAEWAGLNGLVAEDGGLR